MTIGEIIRAYREEHNISQRQFSRQCGMSNSYISMLEQGKNPSTNAPIAPSITALKSIADAMGTTLNDLFAKADDMDIDISGGDIRMASIMGTVAATIRDDIHAALIGSLLEEVAELSEADIQDVIRYSRFIRSQKNTENEKDDG